MKNIPKPKLAVVALVLALVAPAARATWEQPGNPDRFPSFGVNYSNQNLQGDRHELDSPNPLLTRDQIGPRATTAQSFGGDFKFPFSSNGTLSLGVDAIRDTSRFTRQDGVYHENETLTGWKYSLGLRVYINH